MNVHFFFNAVQFQNHFEGIRFDNQRHLLRERGRTLYLHCQRMQQLSVLLKLYLMNLHGCEISTSGNVQIHKLCSS